ncbi:MAG: SDR family NAD(P)-dependent oxidoreductase, partial [Magnetococcales bacterium]|nr:SDR family NAD(P)-dependent oxidoreductase [Magnetococcales bacterium]
PARVTGKNPTPRTILLATEIRNGEDQVAVGGRARVKIRDEENPEPTPAAPAHPLPDPGRKTVLITGGSGGIGAATALLLAASGWSVVIHYFQNGDKAQRLLREITEAGGSACALQADLREISDVE